jgi:hypothetical protein
MEHFVTRRRARAGVVGLAVPVVLLVASVTVVLAVTFFH